MKANLRTPLQLYLLHLLLSDVCDKLTYDSTIYRHGFRHKNFAAYRTKRETGIDVCNELQRHNRKAETFKFVSLATIASSIILGLVVSHVVNRFLVYRHLRHFKGPWLASFSKLWMMKCTFAGTMHLGVADVCAQYGKVYSAALKMPPIPCNTLPCTGSCLTAIRRT